MIWMKSCPRCHGDLFLDTDYYGQYVCCIQCGNTLDNAEESRLLQKATMTTLSISFKREKETDSARQNAA